MSLELEVEVKVQKPVSEEEINEAETERLIGKRTLMDIVNLNDDSKFEYRRFIVKLNQVEGRGDFDGVHTVIYLPYGVFLAKIDYDKFNTIYEAMMGMSVKKISDFKFTKTRNG